MELIKFLVTVNLIAGSVQWLVATDTATQSYCDSPWLMYREIFLNFVSNIHSSPVFFIP